MRKFIALIALFFSCALFAQAQTVNNTNYYNFQKNDGSFNWLRSSDAIPVIIDELLKKGIKYHTIGVGDLIKINDSTRLVITVSFEKNDKQYGFVYEAQHGLPVAAEDRNFLKDRSQASYVEFERDTKGGIKFMEVGPLQANIMLLKETCYWFQFDTKDAKNTVTKDVAIAILRQDVDDYLAKL